MQSDSIRLNKFISDSGYCSRRDADKLIEDGFVKINGRPVEVGERVKTNDRVEVKGQAIQAKTKKETVYIAFNKPEGITCTSEGHVKDNIIDFLRFPTKIFPIGRLDKFSQGLIFLTNDGDIVNKILRAGNSPEKEYIVTVDRAVTDTFIRKMSNGVPILDTVTDKCKVTQEGKFGFRIILTQGLNRQIRRMCEHLGYRVNSLARLRIMNVSLGKLKIGSWRHLTRSEMEEINTLVASSSKTQEASKSSTPKKKYVKKEDFRTRHKESPKSGKGKPSSSKRRSPGSDSRKGSGPKKSSKLTKRSRRY
ncbi:MAG: 23S rRNA pseudouridine(2604) synthase RluF [Lentisphaeraceae bacterium]|nr:23S rRNA pseudouridine(2604) synthase RluF [Lentisphaeraceae bacterium]